MLDRFVEHAPTSIAVKDLEGRYLLFSARGAGADRPPLGGPRRPHRPRGLRRPHRRPARGAGQAASRRRRRRPPSRTRCAARDGGRSTSSSRPSSRCPGPDGELEALGLIAADVTEIRRAETDRMQLAALVQAAPDAIIARDRDGLITTWNPGAEQMFGLLGRATRSATATIELLVPDEETRARSTRWSREVYAGQHRDRARAPPARRRHALPGADLDGAADAARRLLARHAGDGPRHHRPRAGRGGAARARGAAGALQRRPRALRLRRQPRPAGAAELDPAQRGRGDRGRPRAPRRRRARADGAHRRGRHAAQRAGPRA